MLHPFNISTMIKELIDDFVKSDYHTQTIVTAIEVQIGRKLVKGKDRVVVDHVHREDKTSGYEYMYGAVIFEGEVYGFLEVDYSEPCVNFVPSSKVLPI